jgi:molybdopterin-guanine dinucleotide biosynthesis protein A
MQPKDICAVILAGGRSSRMGCNKALLQVNGKLLIQTLVDRVSPVTDQILISSNDPESYKFLDFPIIPDRFPGNGPLAGFHSAMMANSYSLYLLLACDLPNLKTPLLRTLVSLADGFDAVIPRTRDGIAHPLCAVYRRTCFPAVERALARGDNKVIRTFLEDSLVVRWVESDEGSFEDADLANINTPEDLRNLKTHFSKPGDTLKM